MGRKSKIKKLCDEFGEAFIKDFKKRLKKQKPLVLSFDDSKFIDFGRAPIDKDNK